MRIPMLDLIERVRAARRRRLQQQIVRGNRIADEIRRSWETPSQLRQRTQDSSSSSVDR